MTIKEMRQQTYLSQSKFAELLCIPVANIMKWEQGVSSPPDYLISLIEYKLRHIGLVK